jgi:hypothetical protein
LESVGGDWRSEIRQRLKVGGGQRMVDSGKRTADSGQRTVGEEFGVAPIWWTGEG